MWKRGRDERCVGEEAWGIDVIKGEGAWRRDVEERASERDV